MRCDDEAVRGAASRALLGVISQADLDKNRSAMDVEVDADAARLNLRYGDAVRLYRLALERGTLTNVWLRFRLADALVKSDHPDEARQVLGEIERIAPIALDRELARRRIDQLRWPWQTDPTRFKCTVVDARIPDHFKGAAPFGVTVRLRNDGEAIWEGGWKAGSVEIVIRFLDPKGNVIERSRDLDMVNHLPEGGVNPGETVELFVIGAAPDLDAGERMALFFRNQRVKYLDGGMVWREPMPSDRPSSAPTTR
jgi:hypothetical protein